MNLSQLQAQIQSLGYGTDTAAQQTLFINQAYRKLCGMERWPFLEKQDASLVTVPGTAAYTLPMADWRSLDAVRIEIASPPQYYDLQYSEPQDFRDMEHLDRDQGTPFYWSWLNQQLHFYPTCDQAYTVRVDYIMQPPDLAAPTDVPVVPGVYHDLLVWGALLQMGFRERDWLGRQFAQSEYETQLKRMMEEYLVRQRQTGSHVKSSGFWNTTRPFPFAHAGW